MTALALWMLVAGCASTQVQAGAQTRAGPWTWCDTVQQNRPTLICFQR